MIRWLIIGLRLGCDYSLGVRGGEVTMLARPHQADGLTREPSGIHIPNESDRESQTGSPSYVLGIESNQDVLEIPIHIPDRKISGTIIGTQRHVKAAKKALEAIEGKACSYCTNDIDLIGENTKIYYCTACSQPFHKKCTRKWLQEHGTCIGCKGQDERALKLGYVAASTSSTPDNNILVAGGRLFSQGRSAMSTERVQSGPSSHLASRLSGAFVAVFMIIILMWFLKLHHEI
ncbi:hypothetical protein PCANC_27126 [Puccinia coronata f. sp. avenae]|uniref:Phorbol-ester/DAG-type domain-containing protein n=1 Tax=Puccinia coronata f. sp. avenae TaxID=200324 RepID=A0A2N5RXZ5_9BASI|nr:hypothetical protein PCANC_27126 [Puccinia coronata f. sp. avenae]